MVVLLSTVIGAVLGVLIANTFKVRFWRWCVRRGWLEECDYGCGFRPRSR